MSDVHFNFLQDDNDVIIEGSELHQALMNVGLTNFDLTTKAKMDFNLHEKKDATVMSVTKHWDCSFNKFHSVYRYFCQYNSLIKRQLNIILNSSLLLDDHADMVYELLKDKKKSFFKKMMSWIPLFGSAAGLLATAVSKDNIPCVVASSTVVGLAVFVKVINIQSAWNLEKLVKLQVDLHESIKHSLKILRRYCQKSFVSELHEKNENIGNEKYKIILEMKMLLFEILEKTSLCYYKQGNEILKLLPSSLHSKCFITKVDENSLQITNGNDYNKLKNLYYTYVLVQSETMFALANAFNGKDQDAYFKISYKALNLCINKLNSVLKNHHCKLNNVLLNYKTCEIQPIKHIFRATPNSKWHDVYIHLDLTSQNIQLAYKEITSLIELLDENCDDKNEICLIEPITEKMNKAYKQIENAMSSAEFSSLLVAKAQRKVKCDSNEKNQNENLFPSNYDDKTIVMVDKDPVIEDEVFEEYIREEYLKPLIEASDAGIIDDFKLDKLLKKNFMSELKEALVDKQKSMTERELQALKRMYEKIKKDSSLSKARQVDEVSVGAEEAIVQAVPPPAPPLPSPSIPVNKCLTDIVNTDDHQKISKKTKSPVPLPRVKMIQEQDQMPYVQQFSISDCTPNFKFPVFKSTEETFLGSGENSEEESEEDNNRDCSSSEEV